MRTLLKYLIVISIFTGSLSVSARNLICASIFTPSLEQLLLKINEKNESFLSDQLPLNDFMMNKNWWQKRKLRSLLKQKNLGQRLSQSSIERLATELSVLLFGNRYQIDRFIKIDIEQRQRESALAITKENLLRDGLLSYWTQNFEPGQARRLALLFEKYQDLKGYKLFQLLSFPSRLPKIHDQELPPSLVLSIVKNGYNHHAAEIALHLKHQNKIEAYNTFRRLYSPIIFGVIFAFTAYIGMEQLDQIHQDQVDALVANLKKSRNEISTGVESFQQQEFESTLQLAIVEFKQKWGEPPTPEEYEVLKGRIAKALKIKNTQAN